VKVCSLYGDGFYYIPGTQTCLKIGGFLRTEWDVNAGGSFTTFTNGTNAQFQRTGDQLTTRARAVITMDVREQTSYGTLRAYVAAGWNYTSNDAPTLSLPGTSVPAAGGAAIAAGAPTANSNAYLLRAFIQLGGFTFGKTASFYDFFNTSKYTYQTNFIYQDFAGVGVNTYGYTQLLGNGVGATIAVQDNTFFAHPIVDVSGVGFIGGQALAGTLSGAVNGLTAGTAFGGAGPTNDPWQNAGFLVPDIVGNIRVDQAWGGAQVAAILHDNRARYYNSIFPTVGNPTGVVNGRVAGTAHPDDKWGYAVSAGLELNLPWAKGDTWAVQSQYCVGFSEGCYDNSGSRQADLSWSMINNNNRIGLGFLDDGFFANTFATGATGIQLPTVWNIFTAIQHYWVPDIRTSLYGGYVQFKANSSAVDTLICTPIHNVQSAVSASGCADWAAWQIGSRTIWNPVRNLDVGVEALYTDLSKSAFEGLRYQFAPAGTVNNVNPTFTAGSTHVFSGILRVQYNFYP
jgi:porin-like protein